MIFWILIAIGMAALSAMTQQWWMILATMAAWGVSSIVTAPYRRTVEAAEAEMERRPITGVGMVSVAMATAGLLVAGLFALAMLFGLLGGMYVR